MQAISDPISTDTLQSFLIDHSHIRGKLVRLGPAVDAILAYHDYPDSVSRLLAEMLVVVSMLSSNLKSEGVLTLQASGNGFVRFAVVDATHDGHLRGYAELDEEKRIELEALEINGQAVNLQDLFADGRLAITLDQGEDGGRYQGIVELAGENFSDAIRQYFTQSQQVEMAIKLAVRHDNAGWVAAGIMIESIPEEGGIFVEACVPGNDKGDHEDVPEEQWGRTRLFMDTLKDTELLDEHLSTWAVLMRLFNEDGVWAYQPRTLVPQCRCTRERIAGILSTIPHEELQEMLEDGKVSVNCRFCNSVENFTEIELAGLYTDIKH